MVTAACIMYLLPRCLYCIFMHKSKKEATQTHKYRFDFSQRMLGKLGRNMILFSKVTFYNNSAEQMLIIYRVYV